MKRKYLLTAVQFIVLSIAAQNFQWSRVEGLYEYDYGYGIQLDQSGNVYVGGKYEQSGAHFGTTTISCQGNHDMFLVKYNNAGDLQWIRSAGGPHGDYAECIFTNKTNAIYASGEIEGLNETIYFSNSTMTLNTLGDNDIFFARYDLDGNLQLVKSEGSINSEKALGITADANGNIFICGYFTDNTNFNGTNYNGAGGRDAYIAKYDASGNFQWMKKMGSTGRDEAKFIMCDAAGNAYICGMFSNNCSFEGQTLTTYNNTNFFDMFVAKFDGSGNLQWVKTGGSDYDEVAWSMDLDNNGKVYVAGEFNAYAVFSGQALTTTGNADIFVTCYDGSGNLQWVKQAGGSLVDRARGLRCAGNDVYITGQFGSTASFGSHQVTAADSSDVFFAGLNASNGDFQWAASIGGPADALETLGYESGNSICGDGNGVVYATGAVLPGTMTVNSNTAQVAGTIGNQTFAGYAHTDAFVTKITLDNVGVAKVRKNETQFNLYPNPGNGQLTVAGGCHSCDVRIYNCIGQQIKSCSTAENGKTMVDISGHPTGIYFAELISGNEVIGTTKIVVTHEGQ